MKNISESKDPKSDFEMFVLQCTENENSVRPDMYPGRYVTTVTRLTKKTGRGRKGGGFGYLRYPGCQASHHIIVIRLKKSILFDTQPNQLVRWSTDLHMKIHLKQNSTDTGQPARTVQADLRRNFLADALNPIFTQPDSFVFKISDL